MGTLKSSLWRVATLALLPMQALAVDVAHSTLEVKGMTREYLLATSSTPVAGARPLVLVLHGHLGTAANALGEGFMASPLSAWLDIVDREKILVLAPQGLKGPDNKTGWRDCRRDNDRNPRTDDVAFISAIAQALVKAGRVDPTRIYAMGMSNGAMMSLRLALEMQPAPAAIAAVSGTMAAHSDCATADRPVSVLVIHGSDDPLVPYAGGMVGTRRVELGEVISVAATRDLWLKANKLDGARSLRFDFPVRGNGATRAWKETYGQDAGPQVVILTIEHGGHIEPSLRFHPGPLYGRLVGPQNRDLESAEEAWAFFRQKRVNPR